MRQKVIIRLWWEARLSSAARNHLTTFCWSFAYYECLTLYPKRNNCLYFVRYGWSAQTSPKR